MNVSEAFALVCELAIKDGVDKMPRGMWERDIGNWHISLNRTLEERANAKGMKVPEFSVMLEWNGFPAGIIDPNGGMIAAGSEANEDSFIAAIKKEIVP